MVYREGSAVGLNIKNEETHRLARKLARATGETMTVAVTGAIRQRLERIRENSRSRKVERILEIGKECSNYFKEPYKSIDHGDLLYDENGLPK